MLGCVLAAFGLFAPPALGAVLVRWDFNAATLQPAEGTGEARLVGGTLTEGFRSGAGSGDPTLGDNLAWNVTGFPVQGIAPLTAGVEWRFRSVGFESLKVRFDWRASSTASANLHLLYLDSGAWIDAGSFRASVAGTFTNGVEFDLSQFPVLADREEVVLRFVAGFGAGDGYETPAGAVYGSSGTWRLDRVEVSGEPMGTTATVRGVIALPGEVDRFTLPVGTARAVVMDSLTERGDLRWSLRGPDGVVVSERPFGSSDAFSVSEPLIPLVPGDYELVVDGVGAATGEYAFRLLEVADAVPLALGERIPVHLSPARASGLYRFEAVAGDRVQVGVEGIVGLPWGGVWQLLAPSGRRVVGQGLGVATREAVLENSGTHLLLVEGGLLNEEPGTVDIRVVRLGSTPQEPLVGTPVTFGQEVSGVLLAGQTNAFVFDVESAGWLFVDSLTNSPWTVLSLDGPAGRVVASRGMNQAENAASGPLRLSPGRWRLSLTSPFLVEDRYRFRLLEASAAPRLALGTEVDLEGGVRALTLRKVSLTAGRDVFVDLLGRTNFHSASWGLMDPFGRVHRYQTITADIGRFRPAFTGDYTLLVDGWIHEAGEVGSVRVRVEPLQDAERFIGFGEAVEGRIERPGQRAHFRLNPARPAVVIFDALAGPSDDLVQWSLVGPAGRVVNPTRMLSSDGFAGGLGLISVGPGEYTLVVEGVGDAVGSFGFRLLDTQDAPAIALDESIRAGFDSGRETRVFRFGISASTPVYWDAVSNNVARPIRRRILDPSGGEVPGSGGDAGRDVGPIELRAAGDYLVVLEGDSRGVTGGSLEFALRNSTGTQERVVPGATVAGEISRPGQRREYILDLVRDRRIEFDALSGAPGFHWSVTGPDGVRVHPTAFGQDAGFGPEVFQLGPGRWTWRIGADGGQTGPFSFRLMDVAQEARPIEPGTPVEVVMDPGDRKRAYRFQANAGDRMRIRRLDGTGPGPSYTWLDPYGRLVNRASLVGDSAELEALEGTHGIVFDAPLGSAAGTYRLLVERTRTVPVLLGEGTAIRIGETVTFARTNAAMTNVFAFRLATPALLSVDVLRQPGGFAPVSLIGPAGELLPGAAMGSVDQSPFSGQLVRAVAGEYRLRVHGGTGEYAFRILDAAEASRQLLGETVDVELEPGSASVLVRWLVRAGSRYVVETSQDPQRVVQGGVSVFQPSGRWLATMGFAQSQVLESVTESGDLVIGVFGWSGSSAEVQRAGVRVTELVDGSVPMSVGEVVTGRFELPGQRNHYLLRLTSPRRLLMDALSGALVGWSIESPEGVTAVRPLWASDSFGANGSQVLELGPGEHRLTVDQRYGWSGPVNYRFRLIDFDVAEPAMVNVPVEGELRPASATRLHRFDVGPGAVLYLDGQVLTGFQAGAVQCRLYHAVSGFWREFSLLGDLDRIELPWAGTWILTVEGASSDLAESGQYRFVWQGLAPVTPVAIEEGPLKPDLSVEGVEAPTRATAGSEMVVSWTVQNLGTGVARGPWIERVELFLPGRTQPVAVLGSVAMAGDLGPGDVVRRQARFVIPGAGVSGSVAVRVHVDALGTVPEVREDNNSGGPTDSVLVPEALELASASTVVREDATEQRWTGTLRRRGVLDAPVEVFLESSDTTELRVPAQVVIPAGESTIEIVGQVVADGEFDGDQRVTVRASAGPNVLPALLEFRVADADVPRLFLEIGSEPVAEGSAFEAVVRREHVTADPVLIRSFKESGSPLDLPEEFTIPSGVASVRIPIVVGHDRAVAGDRGWRLTVSAAGFVPAIRTVLVRDTDLPAVRLTLERATVREGEGPGAVRGSVVLEGRGTVPVRIGLAASTPGVVVLPAEVVVPAGQTAVSFDVGVLDNDRVEGRRDVGLTARVLTTSAGESVGGVSAAVLGVLDDDGPALRLVASGGNRPEGSRAGAIVTVFRNTPTNVRLAVELTASIPGELELPQIVEIPEGWDSWLFVIGSLADGVTDGDRVVTIRATSEGMAPAEVDVTVLDVDLPELVVVPISAPTSAPAGGLASVSFLIQNNGVRTAAGRSLQRVWAELEGAEPLLLAEVPMDLRLAIGESVETTVQVRMPAFAQVLRLMVKIDEENDIRESFEHNNFGIFRPTQLFAPYTAVVEAQAPRAVVNTPIPLRGRATLASGGPAVGVPVAIQVGVRGTIRIYEVVTDSGGQFEYVFRPLPGESGTYTVGASFTREGRALVQDTFELVGVEVSSGAAAVTEGASVTGRMVIRNLGDISVPGLRAVVESNASGVGLTLQVSTNHLGPLGGAWIDYVLTVPPQAAGGRVRIRVEGTDGVLGMGHLDVDVRKPGPSLVLSPGFLEAGMTRGSQASVQFRVSNEGSAPTPEMQVLVPPEPWLSVASKPVIPPIPPGSNSVVTLLMTPPADLPLGHYEGTVVVAGGGLRSAIPFRFQSQSEALGTVGVEVVDEYTYYASGAPRVTNALIRLTDKFTRAVVVETNSGALGRQTFGGLRESFYDLDVEAPGHSAYRATVLVSPGRTNAVLAFLARETIRYEWTVESIEVEDRTRISIETVFETAVPIPVVTIEPSSIDLSDFEGESGQVDLVLRNHGLVSAPNVRLALPSHPAFELEALVTRLDSLPAQAEVTIPVRIRRLTPRAALHGAEEGGSDPCAGMVVSFWDLVCGARTNTYSSQAVVNFGCGSGTPGLGGSVGSLVSQLLDAAAAVGALLDGGDGPTSGPGRPGPSPDGGGDIVEPPQRVHYSMPRLRVPSICDPCDPAKFKSQELLTIDINKILEPVALALETAIEVQTGGLVSPDVELDVHGGARTCCDAGRLGVELYGTASAELEVGVGPGGEYELPKLVIKIPTCDTCPGVGPFSAEVGGKIEVGLQVKGGLQFEAELSGGCNALDLNLSASGCAELGFFGGVEGDVTAKIAVPGFQDEVKPVEVNGSVQGSVKVCVEYKDGELQVYACTEGVYYAAYGKLLGLTYSLFEEEKNYLIEPDCPEEESPAPAITPLLASTRLKRWVIPGVGEQVKARLMEELGRTGAMAPTAVANRWAAPAGAGLHADEGVCAKVRLQLDQDLVLTRNAFRAGLEIVNDSGSSLEDVRVEVFAVTADGTPASGRFGIGEPVLAGMVGGPASPQVLRGTRGTATWILLPTSEAAPESDTVYAIGGLLTFRQEGQVITVPLVPVPVTVRPDPRLFVHYFHERDVFSDDPFTEGVEPAVPYSLAVLVENRGRGTARNVSILSGRPQIVENERGLKIDFEILGTEVAGQPATPSLTAQFGSIDPGTNAIARWLFRSSLQGHFSDFAATWEHRDGIVGRRLSLLDGVAIHELTRIVEAPAPDGDGRPDFLVNDTPDAAHLPDTLYLSDGTTRRVASVTNVLLDGFPTEAVPRVSMTATVPAGFVYLRFRDPSGGQMRLVRVVRSDGREIPRSNIWATDRVFGGLGERPIREPRLHWIDRDPTGSWTVEFEPVAPDDRKAPVSRVLPLPETSAGGIAVRWAGEDDEGGSGVAGYELWVATDRGPFERWLSATKSLGVVYPGEVGRRYAFYTVAIDAAGNREPAPSTADAATTVIVNSAPALARVEDVEINEGEVLEFQVVATDADQPAQTLRFTLGAGAPAGMTLDASTGFLRWATGEGTGPGAHPVEVIVKDDGIPPASASQRFTVKVREVNLPPSLAAIPDALVREGELLRWVATGSDLDLPPNRLRYLLSPGAPMGVSVNESTGELLWRPREFQGPGTYVIGVRVVDDGVPPLEVLRTFAVQVRDTVNDFLVRVGTGHVPAGGTSSVPVHVTSDARVIRLHVQLGPISRALEQFELVPVVPEVASATLTRLADGRLDMELVAGPGADLDGDRAVAVLRFRSRADAESQVTALHLEDANGLDDGGVVRSRIGRRDGRVYVIGDAPLLEARTAPVPSLVVYGSPGRRYRVEVANSLPETGQGWSPFRDVELLGYFAELEVTADAGDRLFRCVELPR